jgi:hypothetical protein
MKQKLFFLIILLLVTAGCSKDDDDGDTNKPFVGRWQEIARGNKQFPELPLSSRVIEFFEDGTSTFYISTRPTYHTDAELLYINNGKDPDGHTYRYTLVYNLLRLDYVDGMIAESGGTPTFYIYKRIK